MQDIINSIIHYTFEHSPFTEVEAITNKNSADIDGLSIITLKNFRSNIPLHKKGGGKEF